MELGNAYVQLSLSLPATATRDVERAAQTAGTAAGKAVTDSMEKNIKVNADGAFKGVEASAKKAGDSAGKSLADGVNAKLKGLQIPQINLKASSKDALAQIEAAKKALDALGSKSTTAEIRIKTQDAQRELEGLTKKLGDVETKASSAGDKVSSGINKISSTAGKMTAVGAAAGGLSASLIAIAPAAGTMVAAFGPAVAGLGVVKSGMLALKVTGALVKLAAEDVGEAITAGLGDDAEKAAEALAKLPPAQRAVATEAIKMAKAFEPVRKEMGEALFKPMLTGLQAVSKEVPGVTAKFPALVGAVGQVGGKFAEAAAKSRLFNDVKGVLDNMTSSVKIAGQNVGLLPDAMGRVAAAWGRSLPTMAKGVDGIIVKITDLIKKWDEAGKLDKFFQGSLNQLKLMGQLIGNVGSIFVNTFKNMGVNGKGFLQTLVDITGKMAAWVKSAEGQEKITKAFETMNKVGAAMGSALGQALKAVGSSLVAIAPTAAALAGTFAELLKAVTPLLPYFTDMANVLLRSLIPPMQALAKWMQENEGAAKAIATAIGLAVAASKLYAVAMATHAAVTKAVTAATTAWAAITKGIPAALAAVKVAMIALNAAMRANPIGAVVTAITLLVGALVLLYKNNEDVRKAVDAAWKAIKTAMGAVADWWVKTAWPALKRAWAEIKPAIDAVWNAIKIAWDKVKQILSSNEFITAAKTAFENFKTTVEGVWKVISGAVQVAWSLISGIFNTIKAVLNGDFKAAWQALGTMIQGVWDGIKKIISGAWDIIKSSVFGQIIAYLGGQFKQAWEGFKSFIEGMWNGLKTFFSNTWNAIKTTVFDAWQTYIKGPFTAMWNAFKAFFEGLWNGLKTFITTTWNNIKTGVFIVWEQYIKGPFTAMWNAFKAFFENLWNTLKTFLTTTWNAIKTGVFIAWETYIKGPFMTMWNAFKMFFTTLWNTLKTFLMTTWTAIKTTIFDVWSNYIKGPFTAMWNAFKTFFTTLWTAIKTFLMATWTAIKTTILDVWANYIKGPFTQMWNAFKTFLTNLWTAIKTHITNTWNAIKSALSAAIDWIKGTFTNGWQAMKDKVSGIWDALRNKLSDGWNWIKTNVFERLKTFVTVTLPNAFSSAVSAIGAAWNKVQEIVKKPVVFVVNTIIRDGIIKGFNAIASKVGVGTISFGGMAKGGVFDPRGHTRAATGAVLPGYTPGRDVHRFVSRTGGTLDLSGGEAVMRPEFTRAVGKHGIDTINAAARAGGVSGVKSALGLAKGGIVGGSFVHGPHGEGVGGKIKSVASTFWESITGIGNPITGIVNKLIGKIPAAGWLLDLLKNSVTTLMSGVGKTITSWVGGGGGSSVGGGATPGSDGSPGGWASMWNWVKTRFPSADLYSGYRNSRTLSGNLSLHASGRAIDITPNRAISDAIIRTFGKNIRELISPWPSDHYHNGRKHTYSRAVQAQHGVWGNNAHIHWAMKNGGVFKYDDGGWLRPGQGGVNTGRRPEAVLTPEESTGLKNMGAGELADLLRELIDAVERIAPGVGAEIRGAGRGIRAAGRSV